MKIKLPSDANASGRNFDEKEIRLLTKVIKSGTLISTRGTQVKLFEKEFANCYEMSYCYAASSGTAAIHAAIAAIDLEPEDEVITSPITDMGAITPIIYQLGIPVFTDVDPYTLNITPESVHSKITRNTKAIIATHLFGSPCNITEICKVAHKYNISVIEDCSQAYLATVQGKLVGTIGNIGTFSTQQGKHLSTGEGGIVITNSKKYASRIRLFINKGWDYVSTKPDHYFLALNYRMSELQGAVARAQLQKLNSVIKRRQKAAAYLTKLLDSILGITLPIAASGTTHAYWKYPLIVNPTVIQGGAEALGKELNARGVFCVPHYIKKPAFRCSIFTKQKTYGKSYLPFTFKNGKVKMKTLYDRSFFPGTWQGISRVVVLPWNEFYTEQHVKFIANSIKDAVECLRKKRG